MLHIWSYFWLVGKPSLTQIGRRVGRLLGNYRQALGTAMRVIRDFVRLRSVA